PIRADRGERPDVSPHRAARYLGAAGAAAVDEHVRHQGRHVRRRLRRLANGRTRPGQGDPNRRAAGRRDAMHKVEVRPGIWIAYAEAWFDTRWSFPDTVVMVHGISEPTRAWVSCLTHLADKRRVIRHVLPGVGASTEPPGYGWSAGELAADVARF